MNATELRIAVYLRRHGYGTTAIKAIAANLESAKITPEVSLAFVRGTLDPAERQGIRYTSALQQYLESHGLENDTQVFNHLFGRV